MPEILLGKGRIAPINWKNWLAAALTVGVIGLGVKAVWLDSRGYLVPENSIPVGANLASEHFHVVRLNLGHTGAAYLDASTRPSGYASQTLIAGQLVPKISVSQYAPESIARVVVTNKTQLGSGIRPGARVSVWSTARLADNHFDVPKRLVHGATVSRVMKNSAVFGSQNQQVEVLVRPAETPALLAAMASDSPIFLVAAQ